MKKLKARRLARLARYFDRRAEQVEALGLSAVPDIYRRKAAELRAERLELLGAGKHPSSQNKELTEAPEPPPYTNLHGLTHGVDPLELHYVDETALCDTTSTFHSVLDATYFANPGKYADILPELAMIDERYGNA